MRPHTIYERGEIMGYCYKTQDLQQVFSALTETYDLYAPKLFLKKGAFSDTDLVRYGRITSPEEIVLDRKSRFSPKEVLFPISQTLFYFTEDKVTEPNPPKKDAVIFLRSCDLHAVRRLDHIYLENGPEDSYYRQLRDHVKFALLGCPTCFDSCFCVDMGTNKNLDYDFSLDLTGDTWKTDVKWPEREALFQKYSVSEESVTPSFVTETKTRVHIPENLTAKAAKSSIWKEYDSRCINCGRCNFSCPTCTCFTMQDLFYTDNGKVGERRRVWASCMVDGYTDVAGGGSYRKINGERMRFKVMHKALDFKQRAGYQMCVGCGRCDDVCPEYISFSHCLNRLSDAMKEVEDL